MPRDLSDLAFKEPWHPLALVFSGLGVRSGYYKLDAVRHAVERLDPRLYLTMNYYERLITANATLLVERGILKREELDNALGSPYPLATAIASGQEAVSQSPFEVGELVRVCEESHAGHTRIPRYIRGAVGRVIKANPAFDFPGMAGHGNDVIKEATYLVEFNSMELWPDCVEEAKVVVDVWQTYLTRALC
jgi:nitrile hydratase